MEIALSDLPRHNGPTSDPQFAVASSVSLCAVLAVSLPVLTSRPVQTSAGSARSVAEIKVTPELPQDLSATIDVRKYGTDSVA